jgi:hypothetical protein
MLKVLRIKGLVRNTLGQDRNQNVINRGLVIYMILIIKLFVFVSSKNKRIDYTAACI